MNWKIKLVLLFAKFRKPIDASNTVDIAALRKKSDTAAALGSFIYDKKISIASVHDINANGVPVRIYNNSTAKNQRVIVYYHGGGFVLYGLYSHDLVCRRICAMNNCIVVSVEYRLAPEFTFPTAHDDSFRALKWTQANIASFGGNAADMVVMGDSAGGNVSACMAHRCKKENIPLRAQVLIYPWIDGKLNNPSIDKNGKGFLLEKETVIWFREQYTPRAEDRCAPSVSPCYESDHNGLAPAFVLTASLDPLLDDGRKYYEQLLAAGTPATYKEYKDLFHGFINTPLVDVAAMQAYRDIQSFLSSI
ncbi:MAG: alpha/beta hydrolase [Bacteroidetes bacterium]|nr:alpha/beta hydrolase [Bacteroidota bacterium]